VSRDGTWSASAGVVGARMSLAGLVGRGGELVELRAVLGDVAAGRGGVVWVEGEPGIGKSALIAAGLAEAEQLGCQLFWGSASELQLVPLQVLLDALRVDRASVDAVWAPVAALLRGEGLAGVVTPRDVAAMLAEQILILVDRLCAAGPVVMVLDDAQWADEASLSVWSRLAGAARQMPLLLVGACRPVPNRAAVEALRRDLRDRGATVMRLDGLPPIGVVELVVRLVGARPDGRVGVRLGRVVAQAACNPLYVREVVDALLLDGRIRVEHEVAELVGEGGLPGSLPAAIGRRLGFLPEHARSVLRLAALLGPAFSVADLAVVTRTAPTDLAPLVDEATTAGVLTGAGERLMFRHGLIQQALYEGMPVSVRAALHRQAAEALAGNGVPVEKVAEQLLAGPVVVDDWMIDWVVGAAAALTLRAPRLAVSLLRQVRDRVDGAASRQDRLEAALADASFTVGDNEQVEQLGYPVLATTRDPVLAGRMGWTVGYAVIRLGRFDDVVEVVHQALTRPEVPAVWIARLHALQAMSLMLAGHYDAARATAVRAEAEGEQAGDRLAIGYALHALNMVENRQNRDFATQAKIIDRALAVLGDEPQATDLRLLLLGNAAVGLDNLGQPAEAQSAFGRALVLAEQAGTPPRLAALRVSVAQLGFAWGTWDEALAELQAADELPLSSSHQLMARGTRAIITVHRDDRVAAAAHLSGVEDMKLAEGEERIYAEPLLAAWALAAERDAHPAQALTRLLTALDPQATRTFPELTIDSWMWLLDVVRLALAVGDQVTASAATRACVADAERQARPATSAAAQCCQGLLERNMAQIQNAADAFHRLSHPLFQAQALENVAVLYAERGDPTSARTYYNSAIDIYTDLDAAWDIIRADARLRAHGIHRGRRGPRRRPATGWESLTPSERNIAQLVVAGESNPDIAAQLLLSRRTVETHVGHILTKLNARSRIDIVREYTSATKLS
jgi:DNA-binding CsgD family transcriptional regulator